MILRARIAIKRLLARRNFSRYGPPLAAALLAYSERLTFFVPGMPGRIRAVEEAIDIYRRLAATKLALRHDVARSLHRTAALYAELGREASSAAARAAPTLLKRPWIKEKPVDQGLSAVRW